MQESQPAVRAIAFYLPQYHSIAENDEWWGTGFTDWVNVRKTQPLFRGHYQPHVPSDLGYYNLLSDEVRQRQADLAREHGINGFCYYHYWFNGHQLLEQPIKAVLASGRPEFPFCFAWANENWTRRWDGLDQEVLIAQNYSDEDDLAHVEALLPFFSDPRYVKVNGRPIFLVYRTDMLPDPTRTAKIWRDTARRAGFEDLYLVRIESVSSMPLSPTSIGFDAAVEFAPDMKSLGRPMFHRRRYALLRRGGLVPQVFREHWLRPYSSLVKSMLAKPAPNYKRFLGVCPSWDNSPRREIGATIFTGSSPSRYREWFRQVVQRTLHRFEGEERLIFINAWNEWAEGCHLEPDRKYGLQYLEATRAALFPPVHEEIKLLKRKAVRGSIALVARQCVTKLIGFVTNIVLARLLIPEQFGVFAIVSCAVGAFNIFGDAGLAASLIRQKEEPTRDQENSIFCLQQILIGVPALLVVLLAPFIDRLYKLGPSDVWLIQLVALSGFLSSFRVIPSIRLERRLEFDVLARVEIVQSLTYGITAIAFAKLGVGAWSFAVGSVVSQLAGLGLLYRSEPWLPAWRIDWADCRQRLMFGINFQAVSVVSFLRDCITPLFIGFACGAQALGFITLANTTAVYPILLGTMLGRLHFPLFSRAQHDRSALIHVAEAVVRWNNLFVLGLSSVFIPVGKEFIVLVYGSKWCPAIALFYLCAVANLFMGTTLPLIALSNALGRPDIPLRYSAALTIATWILLVPLVFIWGPLGYGFTQTVVQLVNWPLYREVGRLLPVPIVDQVTPTLAAAVLNGVLTALVVQVAHVNNVVTLACVSLASLASFVLIANLLWGNVLLRQLADIMRTTFSNPQSMLPSDAAAFAHDEAAMVSK